MLQTVSQIVRPPSSFLASLKPPKTLETRKIAPRMTGRMLKDMTPPREGWTKLELTLSKEGAEPKDVQRVAVYLDAEGNCAVLFQKVAFWSNHGLMWAVLEGVVLPFSETHFMLLKLTHSLERHPAERKEYLAKFKEIVEAGNPVEVLKAGRGLKIHPEEWDKESTDAMRAAVAVKVQYQFADIKDFVVDMQKLGAKSFYVVECGDNKMWGAGEFIAVFQARLEVVCKDASRPSIDAILDQAEGKNRLGKVWTEAIFAMDQFQLDEDLFRAAVTTPIFKDGEWQEGDWAPLEDVQAQIGGAMAADAKDTTTESVQERIGDAMEAAAKAAMAKTELAPEEQDFFVDAIMKTSKRAIRMASEPAAKSARTHSAADEA